MIELRHISKKYGEKVAVNDVSLLLQDGMYGLLGPNGAGKTTLMRIMASVLCADSGKIIIDGKKSNQEGLRNQIGYLPQKFSFYKYLTVYESLYHVAYMKNMKKNNIKDAVDSVIEDVNLSEKRNDKIGTLSGGMLRRLGIAQAILGNPRLLIVDEPTAGLDPEERVRFRNLLSEICENRTVLISTHIVEDIEYICDNLIIMNNGKILFEKKYEQVLEDIKGKTWEVKGTDDNFKLVNAKIISKRKDKDGYVYKIFGEKPPRNAIIVNPSLEDVYMYYVGEPQI